VATFLWFLPAVPLVTPLRLALGIAAVFFIPGVELVRRIAPDASIPETLVSGFGLQLVLVACVTVFVFRTSGTAHEGTAILLMLGITVALWRPRAPAIAMADSTEGARFAGRIFALVLVVAALAYSFLGVPFDGFYGEDFLQIGYIRKLATLPAIRTDNYLYKTPATLAYVYAPLLFWQAMVVSLTHVDPIVTYHRLRGVFFVLSILVHVMFMRVVIGRGRTAYLGGIVLVLLTASTFGGIAYAWGLEIESGQLAPVTHQADLAIGILAPLAITLAAALLLGPETRLKKLLAGLAPVVPCAVFLIHPRELLQYLMYVAVLATALALLRLLDRRATIRVLLLVGVPLLFAMIVRTAVMKTPGVTEFEAGALHQWRERYSGVLTSIGSALFGPPIFDPGGIPTQLGILWRLPGYALLVSLAPLAIALRRSAGALAAALATLGILALIRVPALSYAFVSVTFSQALFSGEVYLYPAVYTFVGLLIALGAEELAGRYRGPGGLLAAFGYGAILATIAVSAMRVGQAGYDFLLCGILMSAAAGLAIRFSPSFVVSSPSTPAPDRRAVAAAVLAALPLAFLGEGFRLRPLIGPGLIEARDYPDEHPTLPEFAYNQYLAAWPPATEWTRRFDRTFRPGLFTIPPAIMAVLADLPGPAVVDGPVEGAWLVEIHLFTRHYLVHTGTPYMLDAAYRRRYIDGGLEHPVFRRREHFDVDQAQAYLGDNQVRYLLLDPAHAFVAKLLKTTTRVLLRDRASGWSLLEVGAQR